MNKKGPQGPFPLWETMQENDPFEIAGGFHSENAEYITTQGEPYFDIEPQAPPLPSNTKEKPAKNRTGLGLAVLLVVVGTAAIAVYFALQKPESIVPSPKKPTLAKPPDTKPIATDTFALPLSVAVTEPAEAGAPLEASSATMPTSELIQPLTDTTSLPPTPLQADTNLSTNTSSDTVTDP